MKADNELDPALYHVAREQGTEAPFTGTYWNMHEKGMYHCAVCGAELFSSDTKFDSGTGWPSFTEPANLKNIELHEDVIKYMITCKVILSENALAAQAKAASASASMAAPGVKMAPKKIAPPSQKVSVN